jgi:tetratricopeptide (TPR) repeat protein
MSTWQRRSLLYWTTFPIATAAAEKALELDNALAYNRLLYGWDWPGAEREFKRALELNPNFGQGHLWYAQYVCAMAHFDEAVAEVMRAQDSDPLSLAVSANVGLVLYWAREYERAVEQLEKTLQLDPNFGLHRLKRRWRDGTTHMIFELLELVEKLAALVPPPRFNLVRYSGVLAPSAAWRPPVIPESALSDPPTHPNCPARKQLHSPDAGNSRKTRGLWPRNYSWSELMTRVFSLTSWNVPDAEAA